MAAITEDIREIRDPLPPGPASYTGWIVGGVITALLLLAVAIILFRRKLQKPGPTPYDIALYELGHIYETLEHAEDSIFSMEISTVLRAYFEKVLNIPVTERTTEEFLADAAYNPRLSGPPLEALKQFLELCDLAKFASQSLDLDQRSELYTYAHNFIEELHNKLNKTG